MAYMHTVYKKRVCKILKKFKKLLEALHMLGGPVGGGSVNAHLVAM
jgi:hypothetical protein